MAGYLSLELYDHETETGFSLVRDLHGAIQLWLDQQSPCTDAVAAVHLQETRLVAELTDKGRFATGFSTVIVQFAFDDVEVERPHIANLLRELLPKLVVDSLEPQPSGPSSGPAVVRRRR